MADCPTETESNGPLLTLVLGGLVFRQAASIRKELEAELTLDQGLELPGVAGKHVRMGGSVVVPQARQLL